MRPIWIKTGIGLFLVGAALYTWQMFSGPHMRYQPHIRAFEHPMPLPPEGMVTVERNAHTPPTEQQAGSMKNPLPDTADSRARGKTYYEYYCAFCHGTDGKGNGPVGQSYMPKPADLTDPEVQKQGDGELLLKSLTGTGHEPVLARVVPPGHRWYLVTYVRSFNRADQAARR